MPIKNEQSKRNEIKVLHQHSFHVLPHHKVPYWLKLIIWTILILISLVLAIYVLASPTIIAQKTLEYHPLFTYF
jgi:hypothetical protein